MARPWQGIDANERQYNSVHNALVGIILDGVAGVSPELPGHGHRMVSPEQADRYIERGWHVIEVLESQSPVPGGVRGKAQKWMDRTIADLRRLVTDAEAVRSGSRPQKMTPESYDELRKSLGVHEAGRRRAAPQAPEPVTAPSHDDPPRSFTSAGGRTFTLGPADRSTPRDPRPGVLWPILYNGEQAGKLFQDENYGPNSPWHATIRELYWKHAADAPTGVGFDVAAFATAEQALDAWGRSADQILDWAEGKPVYTGYGRGPSRRTAEARHYPKPQPPPRRFVSPTVADFNTLDDLIAHARQEGATHVLHVDDEVHLYFLRRDGQYEKAEVWQKDGYWHTQGPGSRVIVRRPPSNAQAIGGGRRMAEATGRLTPRQIQDFKNGFAEGYREGKHGETDVDGRPASPEAAEGIRRGLAAGARYRPGDNSAKVMDDATAAWIESMGRLGIREAPRGGTRSAHHHPARSRKPR